MKRLVYCNEPSCQVLLTLSVGCSGNQKMPNLDAVAINNIIYVLISLLTFTCIRSMYTNGLSNSGDMNDDQMSNVERWIRIINPACQSSHILRSSKLAFTR